MPNVVPTATEMEVVFTAVRNAGLMNLPGDELLSYLEVLAANALPGPLAAAPLPLLGGNQYSLHLAIAILLVTPAHFKLDDAAKLNHYIAQAVADFGHIRTLLLAAWRADPAHTPAQRMRKTIDQVIATGSLLGRNGAREALLYLLWGDPTRDGNPERRFVPGYATRAHPLPARLPTGAVEKFVTFLHAGLVPNLDQIWGGHGNRNLNVNAFAGSSILHALALRSRVLMPTSVHPLSPQVPVSFTLNDQDCIHVEGIPLVPMLPGSRRNMLFRTGTAVLSGSDGRQWNVFPEQRLNVRAFDEGRGHIQLAHFNAAGHAVAGDLCPLPATLMPQGAEPSTLEVWSCTCGTWTCDTKHRLSCWNPITFPRQAKLRTFLMFATTGPERFHIGDFIQSMYYGVLSAGEGIGDPCGR